MKCCRITQIALWKECTDKSQAWLATWKPIDPDLFLEEHTQSKCWQSPRLHTGYHNGSSLFSHGYDISPCPCGSDFTVSSLIFHRGDPSTSDVHLNEIASHRAAAFIKSFVRRLVLSLLLFQLYNLDKLFKYSRYLATHHRYGYEPVGRSSWNVSNQLVCVLALGSYTQCSYQISNVQIK